MTINKSTNINKANNDLSTQLQSQNIQNNAIYRLLEIQVLVWDNHINVAILNQWVVNKRVSNWHKHKQTIEKNPEMCFHSKRPHTNTTMNDNINMGKYNSSVKVIWLQTMRCFQVIIFLQPERYYHSEVCYQTNQTQCQCHVVIKRNRGTLTSDIINVNLN